MTSREGLGKQISAAQFQSSQGYVTQNKVKHNFSRNLSVDIFKFDHSLFETPIPNYSLFNSDSIQILTDRSPDNDLDWYKEPTFLSMAGVRVFEDGSYPQNKMWNDTLCSIVRHNISDNWRISILYCDRQWTEATQNIIENLLRVRNLEFSSIEITEEPFEDLVCRIIQQFQPREISYYANRDEKEDIIATYMKNMHSNIDYFRINVQFLYSFINPYVEFKKVVVLINKHNGNLNSGSPTTMSKLYFGTYFRIFYAGRRELLNKFVTNEFIPEKFQAKLKFEASRVNISNRRIPTSEFKQYGQLNGRSMLRPIQKGCIPGIIYALKVLICDCNANSFLYGESPIVIIAYDPMISRANLGLYVRQIPVWEPVNEVTIVDCSLRVERLLRINLGA